MAERIWINRMSNFVCRIARLYGAAWVGTIRTVCLCLVLSPAPLLAGSGAQVCVLVPHFKDEYWLSVAYGAEREAARQNAELLFFEAGGYGAQARQIAQLSACARREVDAILIGAVSADDPDLIEAIDQVSKRISVFGLVNALHSDALSGLIGVDWRDMGYAIGRHLADLHPDGSPPKSAILISGPPQAGWPAPLEAGLRDGLAGSSVTIIDRFGDDTGLRQQLALVERAMDRHPGADYLIGSAPAIEAAMGLRTARGNHSSPLLVSTYISHTVLRGLQNGSVMAASFDDPAMQGQMAIRQVFAQNGASPLSPTVGPDITLLSGAGRNFDHIRISPPDYFPQIQ